MARITMTHTAMTHKTMTHKTTMLCVLLLRLFVSGAMGQEPAASKPKLQVHKESFGKTGDGRPVDLYTLTNSHGIEVRAMSYGAIIVSLRVPDKVSPSTTI